MIRKDTKMQQELGSCSQTKIDLTLFFCLQCTFSFEAGRRCDSGEGNFEFDTKEGNFLFQAVEAAINLQKISLPQRQISAGGQGGADTPQNPNLTTPSLNLPSAHSWTPPTPHPRTQIPQPPSPQVSWHCCLCFRIKVEAKNNLRISKLKH